MTQFVPGEGPVPCDLMFIGEGPGHEEDKYGRPFVGKSGRELNRYLWGSCQRTRTSVYVTNLVKYRVPDDGDPTPEDIARDREELEREISAVNPEVIICLGRWSARYFLGDFDMDWGHGIPHWLANRNLVLVPIVHPAAGLHSTEFQGTIAWDFGQLAKLLRGEIEAQAPADEYPSPDYSVGLLPYPPRPVVAIDTEGSVQAPWCLSWSAVPGSGTVWRPDLQGRSPFTGDTRAILHSALHDIPVLRAMGIELGRFDDTMIKAYVLCVEPQGLKSLARRHCGMIMSDYSDLVEEPNKRHAINYLFEVEEWLSKRSSNGSNESSVTGAKSRKRTSVKGGRKSSKTVSRKKLLMR